MDMAVVVAGRPGLGHDDVGLGVDGNAHQGGPHTLLTFVTAGAHQVARRRHGFGHRTPGPARVEQGTAVPVEGKAIAHAHYFGGERDSILSVEQVAMRAVGSDVEKSSARQGQDDPVAVEMARPTARRSALRRAGP